MAGPVPRLAAGVLALVVACGAGACSPRSPTRVSGRLDLILDMPRVELVEGFAGQSRLEVWNDQYGRNPDRDELAVLLPRRSRLRWHIGDEGGRFVAALARRVSGPGAEASPCRVTLSGLGRPGVVATVDVPAAEADPAALPETVREGPLVPLELDLPTGTGTLEIVVESEADAAAGSSVCLLSARVERARRPAPTVLEDRRSLPLMPRVTSSTRRLDFAVRDDLEGNRERTSLPPMSVEGDFRGRPAVALMDQPDGVVSLVVPIEPGSVLRCGVALDDRMPAGSRADLLVSVDGERVAAERVDSVAWRELSVPLGAHAGPERVLRLELADPVLRPVWMPRLEFDVKLGLQRMVKYRAGRVRVGLSNPRLESSRPVPVRIASEERPAVILVQVDTLRADVLGTYGRTPSPSPRIDRIARDSVVWERAVAPSSWTRPTSASLLTGLLPGGHGAVGHDQAVIASGATTLAELCLASGVATGAIVANPLLRPDAGFGRGFQDFAEVAGANARQLNALAQAWLAAHAGQQFLLFLHYFDPHHPFHAPETHRERFVEPHERGRPLPAVDDRRLHQFWRGREFDADDPEVAFARRRYLGEVSWFDEQFGELVDSVSRLGLASSTVIILTSDHGEEFLEHGRLGHGSQLFDETLRVPLMIHAPGGQAGPPRRHPGTVSSVGVFATALDLLGVAYDRDRFRPALESAAAMGAAFSETEKAVSHSAQGLPLRRSLSSVRTDDHLLLWQDDLDSGGTGRLFDLHADPGCQRPLAPEGAIFERLHATLTAARRWSSERRSWVPPPAAGSELFDALAELGYVGAEAPGQPEQR